MHLDCFVEKPRWQEQLQLLRASSIVAHGPKGLALPGTWPSSLPLRQLWKLSGRTYGIFQKSVKTKQGKLRLRLFDWNSCWKERWIVECKTQTALSLRIKWGVKGCTTRSCKWWARNTGSWGPPVPAIPWRPLRLCYTHCSLCRNSFPARYNANQKFST